MAERGGFEPPVEFDPYDGLANRSFRPLRHLSASVHDVPNNILSFQTKSRQKAKKKAKMDGAPFPCLITGSRTGFSVKAPYRIVLESFPVLRRFSAWKKEKSRTDRGGRLEKKTSRRPRQRPFGTGWTESSSGGRSGLSATRAGAEGFNDTIRWPGGRYAYGFRDGERLMLKICRLPEINGGKDTMTFSQRPSEKQLSDLKAHKQKAPRKPQFPRGK